jgi:hypothetical protein
MDHRLGRTVKVFLVVLAAMGLYRLVVVPVVEPRSAAGGAVVGMTPEEAAAIRARADERLAGLGDVFPAGAWERDDPIVLESRQMRLLFKEYHTLPDGRVNLVPCTLALLPDRGRAGAHGGRTLVLRAPQGAVLEFDEPLDLQRGRLAKLIGGSLRGQVTIRGTPSAPGVEDDVEIVTRDVTLDRLEVRTVETVQFRFGRSSGSGRGLVARLTPRGEGSEHGPNIGGVDLVRLERDVRMRLEGFAGRLVPGRPADASPQPAAPVLVNCRGSLSYNVSANVVTLEDHVDVVRTGADSATDHLACDLLAIVLDRPAAAAGGTADGRPRGGLEPVEIQAKGSPVVVSSSAAGLEARAARLGYEIATRRILLDGDEPVSLAVHGADMEARKIDYCPGPPGDPGALLAVGPGWLRTRPDRGAPVQARWQQWLRMRPDSEGHVVSLSGNAEVTVEGQGRLGAGEMHLWLDVLAETVAGRSPASSLPTAGPDLSRVRPSRMLARGTVDAVAGPVTARTDRLELWFRTVAEGDPAAGAAERAAAAPGGMSASPRRMDAARFTVTAALVRGLVHMTPRGGQVEEISMEGQVRLVEQPPDAALARPAAADAGLEILGDQLQLSRATRFDARAVVSGRPARVRARGLDLDGPLVEFDRGRGQLLVDGAGRLRLPPMAGSGGLGGLAFTGEAARPAAPAAAPEPFDVTWQGRMEFDGLTARFSDRVEAFGGGASVRAGLLDVVFDRPFDLGTEGPRHGGPQPQVVRVACGNGVRVESESTAADGQRSQERLFARELVIDRATGDVMGTGPGRLTSTRYGETPVLAVGTSTAAPSPARPPGLTYLGVDFQRSLRGNLHRRTLEFQQRVEAIWGPVDGWEATLDPHAAGGPPPNAVVVSSDALGIGQLPASAVAARPSLELAAGGNVLVEGESFTARSARLTWSEAKDLLVFEGDGRSDARLFRQLRPGTPPSSASAGKILYWRAQERVEVEDARFLDLDQLRGGPATGLPGPRPGPPRPPASGLPAT